VAALVVEHGGNAVQATGALLHDAIEDHPDKITLAQIEQSFGGEVAAIVLACTDAMEHPKPPWRARKEAYIAHLAQAPPAAWLVSCADKLHNARAIRDDLVEIGPTVFDRFSAGPEEVLWYYRTLADTFARLMPGQLATRANRRLIGTVYGSFLMVEERTMPRAYSGDLRRRVVAAALEGGQSREVVARRFAVGRSSVYRWVETAQTEGRLEARPMRGGPRPMIRDETEAALKDMVKSDNHLTLAEYRDRLADRTEMRVHPWTVGRALRRLGLTRKKEDLACDRAGRGRDLGGTPSLA
jgi:transposase